MKGIKLLCCVIFLSLLFILNAYGQQNEILGSRLKGTEVDSFRAPAGEFIDSFKVFPDGDYQVLRAYSGTSSGEIFRTRLRGMELQEFIPTLPGHIDSFSISGPDGDGYVYLRAHSSSGEFRDIFKSNLKGTGVQEYELCPPGEYITALGTFGPDANGYVYLVINNTELGIFELTGFSAVPKKDYVLLNWRTEAEKNSYQWLIQRRGMNGEFVTIGTLEAQGNVSYPTDYQFEDKGVKFGQRYFYRLVEIDIHSNSSYFGPLFVDLTTTDYIPSKMFISQNYPNPFGRMTGIRFGIPLNSKDDITRLHIYDVTGRLIKIPISGKLGPGYYHISWNGRDDKGREVTSGVYFYRLSVGNKHIMKKMVYLK